jgi:hypothetical protein
LLAGSIAAFLVQKRGVQKNDALSFLGVGAIIFAIFAYDETTPFPSVYALVPVLGVVLLVLYADKETLTGRLLSTKAFVGIGLISYSAYLWHQPLFAFARIKLIDHPTSSMMAILSIASICLAFLSWKLVEIPARNRKLITSKSIGIASVLGLTLTTAIGFFGHFSNGFIEQRDGHTIVRNELLVDDIFRDRQVHVRSGICHFNGRGKHKTIDQFLANWSCVDDDENLTATGILLNGDSHSADKAVALREMGFDVFQLAGAGCPLSPYKIKDDRSYCNDILEASVSLASQDKVRAIFLANRLNVDDLSEDYIKSIFAFWSGLDKPIYLFSPMPNFEFSLAAFLVGSTVKRPPEYTREEKFFELVNRLEVPSNFTIVSTSEFWCPKQSDDVVCDSFSHQRILMADEDHLGLEGALIFGNRLVNSKELRWLFDE